MKQLLIKIIYWIYQKRFQFIYFLGGKVIGSRALVVKDNQVLLVQHTYIKGWFTVGGLVEKNETPLMAIKRELAEEAGIQTIEDPKLMGIYYHHSQQKDDYVFLYVVTSFSFIQDKDNGSISLSPEILETRFFSMDDLPEGTSKATIRRIDEYRGKLPISESW